ncbi:nucleotide sugar dehydrogenase [Candidatus Pelagibacter sp.]|jgi:UDP-N-acetyl-D-glucosamine dehydrogenase|nr:nucleotide sugar dehydrogenase [Candidatus Pelagibacter sp.]
MSYIYEINYKMLKNKIKKNKEIIGIFGLGYVGLPLALNFAKKKIKVYGFDIDKKKIKTIQENKSYLSHINSKEILDGKKNGFIVTADYSYVKNLDVIIICVPTPLTKNKKPDLSYIKSTLYSILPHLKEQQLISLESTTYPGTTNEIILPILENKGFVIGKNFFLSFSPERLDPGIKSISFNKIPKITGGITKNCLELSSKIYQKVHKKIVKVSNTQTAEATKLLENVYRAVNIGLVNELKMLTDKLNINIYEIIKAASTKPFGYTPFYPGPGLGGHCIPVDPYYLSWKADQVGINTKFIKLAGEINSRIPNIIVKKIKKILKGSQSKNQKILVLGVAYKKNVNDLRESPGIKIIDLLMKNKFNVSYSDPLIPKIPILRNYNFKLKSIKINSNSLKKFDLTIITTDHDKFNYELIYKFSQLIFDTRGVFSGDKKNKIITSFE